MRAEGYFKPDTLNPALGLSCVRPGEPHMMRVTEDRL